MKELEKELCLYLTEEEATGLLDIVLLSPADLTVVQRAAVLKLSELCREMFRETGVMPSPARTPLSRTFAS